MNQISAINYRIVFISDTFDISWLIPDNVRLRQSVVFSLQDATGDVTDALSQLPLEQVEQFRKYFNMFDKDNKGFIKATQIGQILRTMGQAFEERDLKQLIKEFDTDGSGEIEFEEFAAMVASFVVEDENASLEEELREAFRLYDKEGNGYIAVSDLRDILRALDENVSEEELDEMIADIDTDGSGTVDLDGALKLY
uniref:Troponin C n=1 Tax=Loa loa TaxID=7209 RepID=A0A1I7VLU0_LOALO